MLNLGWNYDYLTRCKAYRLFAFFLIPTLTCRADEELTAAALCVVNVPVVTATRFKCYI
jgi:hypothetical protein